MKISFVQSMFDRFVGDNPLKRFILIWSAVALGILIITLVIRSPIKSYQGNTRNEIQKLAPKRQQLMALNVTGANKDLLLGQYLSNLEEETTGYVTQSDRPLITSQLSAMAQDHQLTIETINFSNEQPVQGYEESMVVPIVMRVTGSYTDLGDYLGRIRRELKYFFNWERMVMRATLEQNGFVTVDLSMSFYRRVIAKK